MVLPYYLWKSSQLPFVRQVQSNKTWQSRTCWTQLPSPYKQGIPFQSAKLNKILKIHSNTAEINTKPWNKPYNNTTFNLLLADHFSSHRSGSGGRRGERKDRRENSTVIIQSKWKMAAVKFRGEGLSNHNPAWANQVHPTITFSNTEIVTEPSLWSWGSCPSFTPSHW